MAFPGRSAVGGAMLASWEAALSLGRGLPACLIALEETKLLPAWELLPSWEWPFLEGVLLGRPHWLPGKPHCPGEGGCLPACKELAITLVALVAWGVSQVIFPSFLHNKLLNLFTCLLLPLLNLNSPTFSTTTWHFLKLEVDKIDANFDLHISLCLALLSRILLMVLILACRSCFSAVPIIFLALSVLKVVFNLILTATNSLWMHLRVKILLFCSHNPLTEGFPIL